MKKQFSILIVSTVITGMILSLAGMALASQLASVEKGQNSYRQASKPIHATDVHLVKKAPIAPVIGEVKGNPHNEAPRNNKNKEPKKSATGVLGSEVMGNKYAIVIGICDYPGTKNDLCISDGDSLRMYKALTTLYDYDPNNIYLFKDMGGITGPDITGSPIIYSAPQKTYIKNAIDLIKGISTEDDEVVFFFSGHGADGIAGDSDRERRDESIVVHKDNGSNLDSDYDLIWDGELKEWFAGFNTSRIAFVFDSCLAGGMNDVSDIGRVVSMGTNETNVAHVYSSDLFNLRTNEMKDVDGDGQRDGEGVFTRYFIHKGILEGNANIHDYDGDETLYEPEQATIEEAFDYAKEIILSIWKRQKPTISDSFENDLLL